MGCKSVKYNKCIIFYSWIRNRIPSDLIFLTLTTIHFLNKMTMLQICVDKPCQRIQMTI